MICMMSCDTDNDGFSDTPYNNKAKVRAQRAEKRKTDNLVISYTRLTFLAADALMKQKAQHGIDNATSEKAAEQKIREKNQLNSKAKQYLIKQINEYTPSAFKKNLLASYIEQEKQQQALEELPQQKFQKLIVKLDQGKNEKKAKIRVFVIIVINRCDDFFPFNSTGQKTIIKEMLLKLTLHVPRSTLQSSHQVLFVISVTDKPTVSRGIFQREKLCGTNRAKYGYWANYPYSFSLSSCNCSEEDCAPINVGAFPHNKSHLNWISGTMFTYNNSELKNLNLILILPTLSEDVKLIHSQIEIDNKSIKTLQLSENPYTDCHQPTVQIKTVPSSSLTVPDLCSPRRNSSIRRHKRSQRGIKIPAHKKCYSFSVDQSSADTQSKEINKPFHVATPYYVKLNCDQVNYFSELKVIAPIQRKSIFDVLSTIDSTVSLKFKQQSTNLGGVGDFLSKISVYIEEERNDPLLLAFSKYLEKEKQYLFSHLKKNYYQIIFHETIFSTAWSSSTWIQNCICSCISDIPLIFSPAMKIQDINLPIVLLGGSTSVGCLLPAIIRNSLVERMLRYFWQNGTSDDQGKVPLILGKIPSKIVLADPEKISELLNGWILALGISVITICVVMVKVLSNETTTDLKDLTQSPNLLKESLSNELCNSAINSSEHVLNDKPKKQRDRFKLQQYKQVYSLYPFNSTDSETTDSRSAAHCLIPSETISADSNRSSCQSFDLVSRPKLTRLPDAVKRRRQIITLGRTGSLKSDTDDHFIHLCCLQNESLANDFPDDLTDLSDDESTKSEGCVIHIHEIPGFQDQCHTGLPEMPVDWSNCMYVFNMSNTESFNDVKNQLDVMKKNFPNMFRSKRFTLITEGKQTFIGDRDKPIGYSASNKQLKHKFRCNAKPSYFRTNLREASADYSISRSSQVFITSLKTVLNVLKSLSYIDKGKTECTISSHETLTKYSSSVFEDSARISDKLSKNIAVVEFVEKSSQIGPSSHAPCIYNLQCVKSDSPSMKTTPAAAATLSKPMKMSNGTSESATRKSVTRPMGNQLSKQRSGRSVSQAMATNKFSNSSIETVQTSRASKNSRSLPQPRRVVSPSPVRAELNLPKPHWVTVCSQLLHVPDYEKMVHILNPVVPSAEFKIAYKFIKGICFFKTKKFSLAIKALTECEALAIEQGRRSDVSLCNVYLGDLYYSKLSYEEACVFFHKAAEYFEPGEVVAKIFKIIPPSLSTVYAKCGSCYRNTSRPMEGIVQYRKAIEVAEKKKDLLTVHTSLGNLYQSQNQFSEALEHYKLSLSLSEELNEPISLAWTHGNLGNAYLALHRKDEALFHLKKALDLTVQYEPTPSAIGRAYNNLGSAHQAMGNLDKAQEHFDLSLSQAVYGNDANGQSRVFGNIGNLYTLRKQFDKAIPHYSEVLRLSQDEATILTALHNRGCAAYEYAEKRLADMERKRAAERNEPIETFRLYGSSITYGRHSPRTVIDSIAKLFSDGMDDLLKVLESHESKLNHIKGSAGGISLSVSLTESNSRTFHRLQDCMVNIGKWKEALIVAEQSKARTLGEMMLTRKMGQLDTALSSPLTLDLISFIVGSQASPVLYLSHTGSSLLGWVMVPNGAGSMNMQMFTIPLADDQFKGKSFDHHIRYALNEVLVENSYEMYKSVEYDEETTAPVSELFELICEPLFMILNELLKERKMYKLILVTDTHTSMLPFSCLYDKKSKQFLGDRFQLELSPSLLTMGVMNQLPKPIVELPSETQNMCIVGNPTIPSFYHNGDVWTLGKLPHAKREAQWVGHILNTPPILEEQATKSAILMRLMRAKIVHIATHGSASAGFLAFSALVASKQGEAVDASGVLLHPEEVEKLSISPALVVLSSCDSARGTFKAEGVQGMARAFLLAGAQAVMTSLWRVPDESAAVFMRFFYRFLVHGFESSLALQKSILSLRCFLKYSQYIHWSGFQLTGRSIRFDVKTSPSNAILDSTIGPSTVFPRLVHVKKLQNLLVDNPRLPTDMQILSGSPGVKPSEIAIDFVHSSPDQFKAGVFWVNCQNADFINASLTYIEGKVGNLGNLHLSDTRQALFILDNATELPGSLKLVTIFKHPNVHIINLSKSSEPLDRFIKEVDKTLIRGCNVHMVSTLSKIDSTQRTVYEVFKHYHLNADNKDQEILDKLAEFTSGSPLIVDIAAQLLLKTVNDNSEDPSEGLKKFADSICLFKSRKNAAKQTRPDCLVRNQSFQFRDISKELTRLIPEVAVVPDTFKDVWESNSEYDSWDSIGALIKCCITSREAMLLVRCLTIFGCAPIPLSLVVEISSLILKSSGKQHLSGVLHTQLLDAKLLKPYPLPVVMHPTINKHRADLEIQFVYVPQHLASHLWKCDKVDQAMAVAVTYKALASYTDREKDSTMLHFCLGLLMLLEQKSALVDSKKCYEKIYELYLELYHQIYFTPTT